MLPAKFVERVLRELGPDEGGALCRALTGEPSVSVRLNAAKGLAAPSGRPIGWSTGGYWLDARPSFTLDPDFHAGRYYVQEASSQFVGHIVAACGGIGDGRVLDLCAAPGGKTTLYSTLAGRGGLVVANEIVRNRAAVLADNVRKWGVGNVAVTVNDPSQVARLEGWFDAVAVDAPCSGEGMFRKEPAALDQWSEDNIRLCAVRGRDILDAAAIMVRPGGRLVYSTCTFAPEENECQIAAFLNRHPDFDLAAIEAPFGRPGLPWDCVAAFSEGIEEPAADLTLCRRITPADGGEGHFVARLIRRGETAEHRDWLPVEPAVDSVGRQAEELYHTCFSDEPQGQFRLYGGQMRLLPLDLSLVLGLPMFATGIAVAELCKNRLEPCHAAFMAAQAADCRQLIDLKRCDERLSLFLKGQEIPVEGVQGWTAVAVEGITVGFGKASGGRLKNRYPKGLRLLG